MSSRYRTRGNCEVQVVISRPGELEVLMIRGPEGWLLPSITVATGSEAFTVRLNATVHKRFGLHTTLLQTLEYKEADGGHATKAILAMENHNEAWEPSAFGRWLARESLRSASLAEPSHRELVLSWLDLMEGKTTMGSAAPWECPGWLGHAISWIKSHLPDLEVKHGETIRQFGTTPFHYLLEVSTTGGRYYFKAARAIIAHEQPLTCTLADLCPDYMPEVVAQDDQQRWWLMRDVCGSRLPDVGLEDWDEALSALGQLQVTCIDHVDRLRATGCPYMSISSLSRSLDTFFDEALPVIEAAASSPLNRHRIDISALSGRLKELCERLSDFNIPETIGRGDLNFANIQVTRQRVAFIDWAEGYVGNPLFSAFEAINLFGLTRPELKGARSRWRAAYFKPWLHFLSGDELMRAYCLARPLALMWRIIRTSEYRRYPELMMDKTPSIASSQLKRLVLVNQAAYSTRIQET